MKSKCLVVCSIYIEDDGFHEMEIIENVTELKQVTDIETEEKNLEFIVDNVKKEYFLEAVEWFRYVPSDSHLANYARNSKFQRYDCEWDEDGKKINQ